MDVKCALVGALGVSGDDCRGELGRAGPKNRHGDRLGGVGSRVARKARQ